MRKRAGPGWQSERRQAIGIVEQLENRVDVMKAKGRVDGFEGGYVNGWAKSAEAGGLCQIEIKDERGRLVASGHATRPRADLAKLGHGDVAFRVAVLDIQNSKVLHVLADGIELPGSPVPVGPGYYDGHFAVINGMITGSVAEKSRSSALP